MRKWIFFISAIFLLIFAYRYYPEKVERSFESKSNIRLIDENQEVWFAQSKTATIEDFFLEQKVELSSEDSVFPGRESPLASGMIIRIDRQKNVTLEADQKNEQLSTRAKTVAAFLEEKRVLLDEDDLIEPVPETALASGMRVEIIRVVISEETEEKPIAYKTETKEDENLSWRKKEIEQKGEAGVLETVIRVARHDGKEVARKILEKKVTKEPVTEIVRQGTLVKVGKSHRGGASWYAHTGTLAAANPWLPMGSYVKVTNTANGKSVIVKINDRGPFGGGRIIDLDKVAFQEIASLGQGVVDVKMEEITN
ncbi:MAG: G5 domain-containing protein [Candidatus Moranbacteria bacterium]|nr:G5 domain-containing protein [Candidatus Moranbacteria bacterium]